MEFIVPGIVLGILLAVAAVAIIAAKNYVKVAPNEVLVVYGKKHRWDDGVVRGFKLITGGAAVCIPFLEKYSKLSLESFQVKFDVKNVPSSDGVRVSVASVATLKIGREMQFLEAASSRFLGYELSKIEAYSKEILEGGLRGVVAKMTVEELVNERQKFGSEVQGQVTEDLANMGLQVDSFVIQDVSDEVDYINSLGKKRTAEVKRDADIGEAEAIRDRDIRVAEAKRDQDIKVAEALRQADELASKSRQEGEVAKAKAEETISNAQKERDVIRAKNAALTQAEQARVAIIAQTAAADEAKRLRVTEVAAEEAEVEARTKLQGKERARKEAELRASLIVEAEQQKEAQIINANATREAAIITAEGERQAIEIRAEAAKIKLEKEAEGARIKAEKDGLGSKLKQEAEAEGRKASAEAEKAELMAQASGEQAKLEAQAAGEKAKLLAIAEGEKQKLLAIAEGERQKLLAEAEGAKEKAVAFEKLEKAGKLILIIEKAPEIIKALGEAFKLAGEGTLVPMSEAMGKGMGAIEEVRIVNIGGNGSAGGRNPVTDFVNTVPETILGMFHKASSLGLDKILTQLAGKQGISLEETLKAIGATTTEKEKTEPNTIAEIIPKSAEKPKTAMLDDVKGMEKAVGK